MIGQATAHRRATAFAQAIEDAGLDNGVLGDDLGAGPGPGTARDTAGGGEARPGPGPAGGRSAPAAHPAPHGHGGGPSHAADRHADPEQGSMVALAAALSSRPRPALDAGTKTVQRAQLIAAMEQAIADGSFHATARVPEQRGTAGPAEGPRRPAPRSRLTRRLAVGGLTMGVAAGALGGVAAASTNALPGDSLYGLKRGMEDIKLDMAGSDTSRGKVYLDLAGTRMQEARRLMDRGRGGQLDPESVAEVRKALNGMHQEASEGHRLLTDAYHKNGSLASMETLSDFAQNHRQGWADLREKLPSQLSDVSDQVTSVFDAIDAEVAPLALPQKEHGHTAGTQGSDRQAPAGSAGPSGSGPALPSTATPSGTPATPGESGTATPSPSASTPPGLLGGDNGLLPPLPAPSDPGTPSPTPTQEQQHIIELPPLLPGLLPGLGLTSEDDGS